MGEVTQIMSRWNRPLKTAPFRVRKGRSEEATLADLIRPGGQDQKNREFRIPGETAVLRGAKNRVARIAVSPGISNSRLF